MQEFYKFCIDSYQDEYNKFYDNLMKSFPDGNVPQSRLEKFEPESQKAAMKYTLVAALRKFPDISPADIWRAIHVAHMYRKTGLTDLNQIDNVVSADQSWKKSSGHAFEEMLKDFATLALDGTGIEVILQRDLNLLLLGNELGNEVRDYSWLKEQVKGNIFDLYAIVNRDDKKYCFACIQAKTSIRDRVTRDREPSIHAMNAFFWSIVFVLDDGFMKLPKFNHMVNGGSTEFPDNGWHGMYAFTKEQYNDRIYSITIDFEQFRNHAIKAANDWLTQRQWFDQNWRAE